VKDKIIIARFLPNMELKAQKMNTQLAKAVKIQVETVKTDVAKYDMVKQVMERAQAVKDSQKHMKALEGAALEDDIK